MHAETILSQSPVSSPAPVRLWSAPEIAAATGLCVDIIRDDMESGLLPSVSVGRGAKRSHRRVHSDALRTYARKLGLPDGLF